MKTLFAVLALIAAPAFAQANDDRSGPVSVKATEKGVEISIVRGGSNGCFSFHTTALTIERPKVDLLKSPSAGLVSVTTEVDKVSPDTMCTMALRFVTETLVLPIGNTLPAISSGYWALEIDGESYGYISLGSGKAELVQTYPVLW